MASSRTPAGVVLGIGIFLLALGTAAIHLYLGLNFGNMLFVLNGPGYLGLLAVLRLSIPQARHRVGVCIGLALSRVLVAPRRPVRVYLDGRGFRGRGVLRRGSPTRRVCRQEPAQPAIEATAPSVTTASPVIGRRAGLFGAFLSPGFLLRVFVQRSCVSFPEGKVVPAFGITQRSDLLLMLCPPPFSAPA